MKNTLLLIFLFLFSFPAIFAQDLILIDQEGNNITNDTIFVDGLPTDDLLKAQIFLVNESESDLQIWVRKTEDDLIAGSYATFCWNGSCFPPDVFEVDDPLLLPEGQTSLDDDFYGEYRPMGNEGISYVSFEFFSKSGEYETIKFVAAYTAQSSTSSPFFSQSLTLSSPSPNPASSFTSFDISIPLETRQASFVVRDLTGRIVLEEPVDISNTRLQLNVGGLNNGIFLYSLVLDGKPVITRKLVVAR